MTAQETIKKLILFAEHKRRLQDDPIQTKMHYNETRRLRKELLDDGISPELLDMEGDEIAQVIHESLIKRGYA